MKNPIFYLAVLFFCIFHSAAESQTVSGWSVYDGPYILAQSESLKAKWIENSILKERDISPGNFPDLKKKFNLQFNYADLKSTFYLRPRYRQNYTLADSIAIITDIHGEYYSYIKLMKAMGIIDRNLNWKFGRGHLVVLGDNFDRGEMVTELLWHLFGLEKQAEKAGGMVHVLLGNHEFLILGKNLTYLNNKYRMVEEITKTKYYDLYSDSTVLGRWLRTKPVMITINNIIFVHGGISMETVQRNLKVDDINRKCSDRIVGRDKTWIDSDEELVFLNNESGPVWYRGYITDTTFCESKLDSILDFYGKDHIVIGHTVTSGIRSFYNNKLIAADAGIMYKQPGEMLIYKNGDFYRGFPSGKRIKLQSESVAYR
ncbi:MAG: metallophosphoesterase [Bacteroidales bacterium]|nr:metallophosphoesterase [Bacteroidales bacterium]